MSISIKQKFEREDNNKAKNWEAACAVVFTAWVAPEDVTKAKERVSKRVTAFLEKHSESRACDGIEAFEAYNGEYIVECALENPANV